MDDAGSVSDSKESAQIIVDLIAAQDPDEYLQWELDYPEEGQDVGVVHYLLVS